MQAIGCTDISSDLQLDFGLCTSLVVTKAMSKLEYSINSLSKITCHPIKPKPLATQTFPVTFG